MDFRPDGLTSIRAKVPVNDTEANPWFPSVTSFPSASAGRSAALNKLEQIGTNWGQTPISGMDVGYR
jgi:hypothetical protein